jgi:hypothetical protein
MAKKRRLDWSVDNYCSGCGRKLRKYNAPVTEDTVKHASGTHCQSCYWRLRAYGVSSDWFEETMRDNSYSCRICGTEFSKNTRVVIDHDHSTGEARSVVCNGCNSALGLFGESQAALQSAVTYLQKGCIDVPLDYRYRKSKNDLGEESCTGCGEYFPVESYLMWTENRDDMCKRCRSLWRRYQITSNQYQAIFDQQDRACVICKKNQENLDVDHDHSCCKSYRTCGRCIRGLLCPTCNTGLGHVRDSTEILESIIRYIDEFTGTTGCSLDTVSDSL